MDTAIKIRPDEFNLELFKKIQKVVDTLSPHQITISFSDSPTELNEEYEVRLMRAVTDLDAGKGVKFTMDELAELIKQKD